ncbi:hypothetical protein LTR17_026481 [Elasticomyces elasticus]|nr:hypothetical protein LTR17_026481 [Elasticomyces elasticus]
MASLLTLPPELLEDVLGLLGKADLKNFRRVSHECTPYATPLVFQKISIDLEPGGCDGLVSIARTPNLAQHVGTIHLERRNGLKTFNTFEDWRSAIGNQCDLFADKSPEQFQIYHSDKKARDSYWERVAVVVFSAITAGPQIKSNTSDAQCALGNCISGLEALTNVRNPTYSPAFENSDRWGRSWRNIQFLAGYGHDGIDPDVDALQQYFVLRVMLQAPNLLQSVEVHFQGHAFWTTCHLHRLLHWTDTPFQDYNSDSEFGRERIDSWTDEIGGPRRETEYTEALGRELVNFASGFSRLSRLEYRLEGSMWTSDPEVHRDIASAVSRTLRKAVKLQHLVLVFREGAGSDSGSAGFCLGLEVPTADTEEMWLQSCEVSHHLLSAVCCMESLGLLHLSFAVNAVDLLELFPRLQKLRHLRLNYVALLPTRLATGQFWEAVLQCIAQNCQLNSLYLHVLGDQASEDSRTVLNPSDETWNEADIGNTLAYQEYEAAVVSFVLRKSESLPPLVPGEFLRQKRSFANQLEASVSDWPKDQI